MIVTNNEKLPKPFVDAASGAHTYRPNRFSVTELLKGDKEIILNRRHYHECTEDASDRVWQVFGSAVHSILEQSECEDWQLQEWRICADFTTNTGNKFEVSGIVDLYDFSNNTITDYKTASVWKVQLNDWDDYRTQCLYYAAILEKLGIHCRRAELVVLLKDHSKAKAKFDTSYPQHPVIKVCFDFTDMDVEIAILEINAKLQSIELENYKDDDDITPCSDAQRWARGGQFAVYDRNKDGSRKAKASRLLDTMEDAEKWAASHNCDIIEQRPVEYAKCADYCTVSHFCKEGRACSEI